MVIATFVLAILCFLSSILPASMAQQLRRRVVDDSDPAISYTVGAADGQQGQWAAMDATEQTTICATTNCQNALDTSQVYGGTWHEGSGSVTVSYTFTGTGVAAYFVSSNPSGAVANTSFFVDGQLFQTVRGATNGTTEPPSYNVQAFAVSGLPNQSHKLVISQTGGPSAMLFDYLTYDEGFDPTINSDGLSISTAVALQATVEPVDPLRVPVVRSAANKMGAAVAGALIGTLVLFVALGVFLRLRTRKSLTPTSSKYDIEKEAQSKVNVPETPRPSDFSSLRVQHSMPDRTISHYPNSTIDDHSDESSATQPEYSDRRSRFRSAVSTVVAALTPCQITSFSRVEVRTALAALIHSGHQQTGGALHNTHDQGLDAVQPDSSRTSTILPPPSIPTSRSPSLRSVSSISSGFRPLSVPPTAPLRLPRSSGQSSPPALPRFTFEDRQRHRPDTITDPETLQRQIQALLWNAPPLPTRARTPSAPPPYVSRPSTPRSSLASRRTMAPPNERALPLPPLPPFPEKVAGRI